MLKGFIIGFIAALLAVVIVGYLSVELGLVPANADARPSKIERWAAHTSLDATLAREAPASPNPVPLTDANVIAGIKLYAANCVVCHGAADHARSTIAAGLFQKAPQLAEDGVEDDPDGVTFWKVDHGIRYTGMPSFRASLTEGQIWQLALFLKNMDKLSPAAQRVWMSVKNPVAIAPPSREGQR